MATPETFDCEGRSSGTVLRSISIEAGDVHGAGIPSGVEPEDAHEVEIPSPEIDPWANLTYKDQGRELLEIVHAEPVPFVELNNDSAIPCQSHPDDAIAIPSQSHPDDAIAIPSQSHPMSNNDTKCFALRVYALLAGLLCVAAFILIAVVVTVL